MRTWISAALSLAVALLGLGIFVASLDVPGSSLASTPLAIAVRDEQGRPICRRNAFADPQRPLIRIGAACR